MKIFRKRFIAFISAAILTCTTACIISACTDSDEPTKPVASLTIVSSPTKTEYEQGEYFDSAGLVINATFEDNTTEDNVKYTINPDRPLEPTDTVVAAKYGEKQVTINIKVTYLGNNAMYNVENTPAITNSPLNGKTYLFLGSSVTYGANAGKESMSDYIAKRNNCTTIKKAVSGTTLGDYKENSYVKRLENYIASTDKATTLDAFICQLSTNDALKPENFGTITAANVKDKSAFDKTTTYGAMEYITALVKETWDCPVIFYTNSRYDNDNYSQMVTAVNSLKSKWNITVIDLFNDTEFNNISESELKLYMTDEIHPTKAGYREWWTPKFEEALKDLLN